MKSFFRVVAILLLITWFLSAVVFAIGELVHLVLLAVVVFWLLGWRRKKPRGHGVG